MAETFEQVARQRDRLAVENAGKDDLFRELFAILPREYGQSLTDRAKGVIVENAALQARVAELEKETTQRGARMQILWEALNRDAPFYDKEMESWFDDDGVPKRSTLGRSDD